ncbi:FliM/FliN family flagellar motor C-terminal domain-containing protein [Thalassomonas actiniarum]|uniref:FliM/FliN family flagellar motor switch protein n=1 Tax=Thalassomonas actiniarum TaxID=485447 RepID=A0AAE9YQD0_9GAMM|nr:FliM/FliN family flagellar motor C-terminal domain-containing protein [Thalassomonas actiniarum]WDD99349.1 FliM/FliN family flagellar motor switch protein [Thalassomonas actiniarum]
MPGLPPAAKRILAADEAIGVELYDLLGDKRHRQTCLNLINSCHHELLTRLETQCIRLLNDHECKLELSQFASGAIAIEQDTLLWLQATNTSNEHVILAINYATLYNLAEIFLGGQQAKIAKKAGDIKVSDSELRLLTTLLNIHLTASDQLLDLDNQWQVLPINKPETGQEYLTASSCLTIKDYQATWDIWYQPSIISTRVAQTAADTDQGLLEAKLAFAAEKIPTELNLVLAKTRLTVAQLTRLRKDDLIMLDLPEVVSAYAGKQVIAQGRVVEKSGQLVMQVTDVPQE